MLEASSRPAAGADVVISYFARERRGSWSGACAVVCRMDKARAAGGAHPARALTECESRRRASRRSRRVAGLALRGGDGLVQSRTRRTAAIRALPGARLLALKRAGLLARSGAPGWLH